MLINSIHLSLKLSESVNAQLIAGIEGAEGFAVMLDFWCGFSEIFILSCDIAVLQNHAVCGI